MDINVNNSESISILDNEKENGSSKKANKKYKKKKNKSKKGSQNSDLTTTSTTSSKDTTVESDTNELSGLSGGRVRPQPQVSRLPGQIKPKRWQKWNWRSHIVPTSTFTASTASAAATASAASNQP